MEIALSYHPTGVVFQHLCITAWEVCTLIIWSAKEACSLLTAYDKFYLCFLCRFVSEWIWSARECWIRDFWKWKDTTTCARNRLKHSFQGMPVQLKIGSKKLYNLQFVQVLKGKIFLQMFVKALKLMYLHCLGSEEHVTVIKPLCVCTILPPISVSFHCCLSIHTKNGFEGRGFIPIPVCLPLTL